MGKFYEYKPCKRKQIFDFITVHQYDFLIVI